MKTKKIKQFTLLILIPLCLLILTPVSFSATQQVSSTTAQTIVDRARVYLNETTAKFWTDAQLLQYVNDGMVDIVAYSQCLEATEDMALAEDTMEYSIQSTYSAVKAVHYIDSDSVIKGLLRGNPQSVGYVQDPNEPVYWYEFSGKIGVYPVLSSTVTELITNGNMELDANWNDENTPASEAQSTVQYYEANAGSYSRLFTVDGADQGTVSDAFTTVTATKYYYHAWVYPDDTTTVNVFTTKGSDGSTLIEDLDISNLTQDAWNLVTGDWTEVTGGVSAEIGFRSPTGVTSGSWYIDDVSVSTTATTASYVHMFIVTRPTAITLTDSITIPAIYDKALTMYVVAQAWAKDKQNSRYAQFMNQYYQELNRFRYDMNEIPQTLQDVQQ